MKFMKLADGSFHKFHMQLPLVKDLLYTIYFHNILFTDDVGNVALRHLLLFL